MDGPFPVLNLLRFRIGSTLSTGLCLSIAGKLDLEGGEASAVRSMYPEVFRKGAGLGEAYGESWANEATP